MLPIQILGAGVAGLSLARALRRRDLPSTVYEKAPALRDGGGALTLWSNGVKALEALGIDLVAAGRAVRLERAELWSEQGQRLAAIPVEEMNRRLGCPSVVVRRSDLMAALLEDTPSGDLRWSAAVEELCHTERGAALRFADGTEVEGAAVVGADGLHSFVRDRLFGAGGLRPTGQDIWMGYVPPDRNSPPPGVTVGVVGRGQRFWIANTGNGEVHWYAVVGPSRRAGVRDQADLARAFQAWPNGALRFIEDTPPEALKVVDITDRAPLQRWSIGSVTLLGNAAHPHTPDLGQGACQALESAVCLAESLATAPTVPEALGRYEALRVERANTVQRWSRLVSDTSMPEERARCALRDLSCRLAPPAQWLASLETLLVPGTPPWRALAPSGSLGVQ